MDLMEKERKGRKGSRKEKGMRTGKKEKEKDGKLFGEGDGHGWHFQE